jgi:hypothetical protein
MHAKTAPTLASCNPRFGCLRCRGQNAHTTLSQISLTSLSSGLEVAS